MVKFNFPYEYDEWVKLGYPVENYHRHTTWSNVRQKDSVTTLKSLIDKTKENNGKILTSVEHGWQGAYLEVYEQANANDLKYVYGTEAYWVKDRFEKDKTNCHIILISRTLKGSKDINFILSMANEDGYYYKPRIDLELIMSLDPKDVYITSACIGGWKYKDAEQIWLDIHKKFGDSFFLEVQMHHSIEQKELNRKILNMSKEHDIQIILGIDTHYVNDDEKLERENYLAQNGIHYDDEDYWFMDYPNGETIIERMTEQGALNHEEIINAMMNTHVFINGCENIVYDRSFKIPSVYKGLSPQERKSKFKEILLDKYEKEEYKSQEKYDGMMYEYNEIVSCNTEDYFMLNEDIIRNGVEKYGGVITTTSRGSAGSFITSKLLGFTTIDRFTSEIPMYPQRFLTADRILKSKQLPDVDQNLSSQEPFVKATKDIVGEYGCYPLVAWGQLKEKSSWKMFADLKGVEPSIANEVSKHIDRYSMELLYAEEDEKDDIIIEEYIPEEYLDIYYESTKYKGIVDSAKGHACGFLCLDDDIRRECGIIRCVAESTGNQVLCTVIDGSKLDSFGYVKNDYLIVSVVDLIDRCWKSIGQKVPTIDELRRLIMADNLTWEVYEKGATMCVNQCEKVKTAQKVMTYKPKNLAELSAFVAGIRPSFKSLISVFLNREDYSSGEDAVDKILSPSYGFMLYQESLMQIFAWLGIDMKETYDIIKAISKKKLKGKKLLDFEQELRNGWMNNVGNLDNFDKVYQVIKDSAKYAFNSPHALATACDSAYIAYFKSHYPSKFYEISLNYHNSRKEKDKVKALLVEATTHFNMKMGEYEYGKDNSKFTVIDNIIYPDLSSIKGVGDKVVGDLLKLHSSGHNSIISVYMSIKGTSINKTHIRNLIKIGYFKKFGNMNKLLKILDIVDTFGSVSQLSKEKMVEQGYDIDLLSQFGRTDSKMKTIMDVDRGKLIKHMISQISDEEDTTLDIMKNQNEVLGFIDYKDSSYNKRVVMITEIEVNPWGTPFFDIYRVCDGSSCKIKVDKAYYQDNPIDKNEMIMMGKVDTKQKKRKDNKTGKWSEVGEEKILTDYSKVIF